MFSQVDLAANVPVKVSLDPYLNTSKRESSDVETWDILTMDVLCRAHSTSARPNKNTLSAAKTLTQMFSFTSFKYF